MVAILFILMVAVVIAFEWIAIHWRKATSGAGAKQQHLLSEERLHVSDGLFYSAGHCWSALDANGTLAIGADDLILRLAGRVDGVDLPAVGSTLDKGDPLFTLRMGGQRLSVPSPARGEVEAVNHEVVESPVMMRVERDGWAVRLRPETLAEELAGMNIGVKARAWIGREIARLRDFFAVPTLEHAGLPITLQDGGLPTEGALAQMDNEALRRFEREFLSLN
jgi:glycine cleavage system H lipoate-binding protein